MVAVSRLRSNTRDSAVNQPSLLPTPQVTTLVTTVFLVVKVILSNVSDPHLTPPTSTPPHLHAQPVDSAGLLDLWAQLAASLAVLCRCFILGFLIWILTCNISNILQLQDDTASGPGNLLSQNAFGYVLSIASFVVAWLETWFLDFKVLTQEADDERGESSAAGGSGRGE